MSAILGIGCIIDTNELIDALEQSNFLEKFTKEKSTISKDSLRENINEVVYDYVNNFCKDNNLPFKFYTPYVESRNTPTKSYYIMKYKFSNPEKNDNYCESIDYNTIIEKYETISEHFKVTLTLLFAGLNIDKFNLVIFSNYSE